MSITLDELLTDSEYDALTLDADGTLDDLVSRTGFDALEVTGTPPAPQISNDAITASVYNEDGDLIAHLPHAIGLRWLDEYDSPGSGSIEIRRFDTLETTHTDLWAVGNRVLCKLGATLFPFAFTIDGEPSYRIGDDGERYDVVAGLGPLGVIHSGMVQPEYGWRNEATNDRTFDYGSNPNIGGWYVASEWKTPKEKLVTKSTRWTRKNRHLPKGWPDRRASWIWWSNPDNTKVKDETCYFTSTFTLAEAGRVKIWACGDDNLELQVDGEVRLTQGRGDWVDGAAKCVVKLSAGQHRISAKVTNSGSSTSIGNRSGFLCTVRLIDADGDIIQQLRRTNANHWLVRRGLKGPPGWFPAQIWKRLIEEQALRECAGHDSLTFGFTTKKDSMGRAWTRRTDISLPVGTLGLDYTQKLVETKLVHVAARPVLTAGAGLSTRLDAYVTRGRDRSSSVLLTDPADDAGAVPPTVRNVLYGRAKTGWVGRTDTTSVTAAGRRERIASLAGTRSRAQTGAALVAMLDDLADPPQTITARFDAARARFWPYRDFEVGDWISYKPTGSLAWTRHRVMSISVEVTDGSWQFTLQLYEDGA